jgi:prevent-host-death family protein
MKTAKISELKNELSRYLRYVRRGESVVILDRDRPVARIEPVRGTGMALSPEWLSDLAAAGVVRAPRTKLSADWLSKRPTSKADVVGALLEERESGR